MKAGTDIATPNPLPRPSQITEWMKPGEHYCANQVAQRFKCKTKEATAILREMVIFEAIKTVLSGNRRSYYIPLPAVLDPNLPVRYVPEWKPLIGSEAKRLAFMAGCLATRKGVSE